MHTLACTDSEEHEQDVGCARFDLDRTQSDRIVYVPSVQNWTGSTVGSLLTFEATDRKNRKPGRICSDLDGLGSHFDPARSVPIESDKKVASRRIFSASDHNEGKFSEKCSDGDELCNNFDLAIRKEIKQRDMQKRDIKQRDMQKRNMQTRDTQQKEKEEMQFSLCAQTSCNVCCTVCMLLNSKSPVCTDNRRESSKKTANIQTGHSLRTDEQIAIRLSCIEQLHSQQKNDSYKRDTTTRPCSVHGATVKAGSSVPSMNNTTIMGECRSVQRDEHVVTKGQQMAQQECLQVGPFLLRPEQTVKNYQ